MILCVFESGAVLQGMSEILQHTSPAPYISHYIPPADPRPLYTPIHPLLPIDPYRSPYAFRDGRT